MRSKLILAACVLLVGVSALLAQDAKPPAEPTGGIVIGRILYPDGKPAVDCIITLQQASRKMRKVWTTATDAEGKFTYEDVVEDEYVLNARPRDGKGRALKSVFVYKGKTTDLKDVTLKPT